MNKLEQVARCLADHYMVDPETCWRSYEAAARAAIKAMREPTVDMQIAAACEIAAQDIVLCEDNSGPLSAVSIFRAMIDAAIHQGAGKS